MSEEGTQRSTPEGSVERKTHEHRNPCKCGTNAYFKEDDEYGSLASGGSYEVCSCSNCGAKVYVPLPD